MATKTGAELKQTLLGDAEELKDATKYDMDVVDIAVRVKFDYTISDAILPDTGERSVGKVVRLTDSELSAGLTSEEYTSLLNLIASKV